MIFFNKEVKLYFRFSKEFRPCKKHHYLSIIVHNRLVVLVFKETIH
jgi:hypothetical protein